MSHPHIVLCDGCNRYFSEEDTEECTETGADYCQDCWDDIRAHEREMDEDRGPGVGCLTAIVFGFFAWAALLSALGLACRAIWGPWWNT